LSHRQFGGLFYGFFSTEPGGLCPALLSGQQSGLRAGLYSNLPAGLFADQPALRTERIAPTMAGNRAGTREASRLSQLKVRRSAQWNRASPIPKKPPAD